MNDEFMRKIKIKNFAAKTNRTKLEIKKVVMSELQEVVYVTAANRLAAVGGGRWRFGGGGRTGSPTCVPTLTEC